MYRDSCFDLMHSRPTLLLLLILFALLAFTPVPASASQSGYDPRFDLNDPRDGVIDYRDLMLFLAHFGAQDNSNPSPTATPTPTPTSTPSFTPTVTPISEITVNLPNLPVGTKPLVLVRMSPGSFMMGRRSAEQDSSPLEDPRHQVIIDYAFYIGKYEITKAQWQVVMNTTPWADNDNNQDPDSPATYVSWNDIRGSGGFLEKLNLFMRQGKYRLPSEAEWEYACRAGTTARFYWGDDPSYSQIGNYAWYEGNAFQVNENYAHQVGLKAPNAWGLYDMSGNVAEWCEDDWHANYTSIWRPDDGGAWVDSPRASIRMVRGGYWLYQGKDCRSASRYEFGSPPSIRGSVFGLRLAWTP